MFNLNLDTSPLAQLDAHLLDDIGFERETAAHCVVYWDRRETHPPVSADARHPGLLGRLFGSLASGRQRAPARV